jgi:autotransporter-associated beta strand protein
MGWGVFEQVGRIHVFEILPDITILMKLKLSLVAFAIASISTAYGQTSFTSTSATTAWNASRWNNTANGPTYTTTYTANNAVSFTSGTYSFAGMGANINVGNITLGDNVTVNFASAANTFQTNGAVRTISVGTGGTMNFAGQSISSGAGTGFIKTGAGTLIINGGNTYNGGFTLGAGTMIAGGVNAMGAGSILNLNGGILSVNSSTSRDFTGKYTSGITVGGDVQFGDSVNVSAGIGNMTFSNTMALGGVNRTLTLGYSGNIIFGGVISNTGSNGVTFAATAGGTGRFDITNATNTFTGPIGINGGEVRFSAADSFGNVNNDIVIDGGLLSTASGSTYQIASTHGLQLGATAGSAISVTTSGTLTYNGIIANKTGSTGILVKQGAGILSLGGASTYTGATTINQGTLQLTTSANRLPIGTVVSIGQASSTNLGTLNMNGQNQEIAGLQSISGTNAGVSTNVVTSSTAAILKINCSTNTTYTYGSATAANSGVISGAISVDKSGEGTEIFGGNNSYTGTTTINLGTLMIEGAQSGGGTVTVGSSGKLGGDGSIAGSLVFSPGADFVFSTTKTFTVNGASVSFGGLSISDLFGLDSTVANGVYTLINGSASIDFANVSNLGIANAFNLGSSKSAYFQSGSLQVVVIPEPDFAALLGGLGVLGLLRRRR